MLKLTDREWKEFFIGGPKGVFNIRASNSGIDKNKLLPSTENNIPYITRSNINNGISDFIGEKQLKKFNIDNSNVITIGLDTQTVFYQPHSFYTGQNIQVLSNNFINKYNSLFIIQLLKIQLKKFSWGGNGATLGRLENTKILLPVNNTNLPDYKFMENYIKEVMTRKRKEYIIYAENKLKTLPRGGVKHQQNQILNNVKWKEFKVGSLFTIEKCKCSNVSLFASGKIPYIGATNKNNGIMNFITTNKKYITKGNCLVFICDGQGSVGYSIYKKENFVGSTTLKIGRNSLLNRYNALFFTTSLDKNKSIYSYGYKRNENRLKNEYIMLPITQDGKPDYQFMENYISNITFNKYNEYLTYAYSILSM